MQEFHKVLKLPESLAFVIKSGGISPPVLNFREVTQHSICVDLEAAKALSSAPAALNLFMWISYRCFTAKHIERVPIFGPYGIAN